MMVTLTCVFTGTMPLAAQEQALVEDLLYVLIGVDGRDITAQPVLGRQCRSFIVDPSLDMSIKELVNRILPVASCYSTITRSVNNMTFNIYISHVFTLSQFEITIFTHQTFKLPTFQNIRKNPDYQSHFIFTFVYN